MSEMDKCRERLEQATERSPITHPYGFFIMDEQNSMMGMYHWYESEKDMLDALRNDLISIFYEDDDIAELSSGIRNIVDMCPLPTTGDDALCQRLDQFMSDHESWGTIKFIGGFEQLCGGNGDWEVSMRQYYRGYNDSESKLTEEDAAKPIPLDERSDFADVISSYSH